MIKMELVRLVEVEEAVAEKVAGEMVIWLLHQGFRITDSPKTRSASAELRELDGPALARKFVEDWG